MTAASATPTIRINAMLTPESADRFCAETDALAVALAAEPPGRRTLRLLISYPGGKVAAGMAMVEQVRRLQHAGIAVEAVIVGEAGSMTAVLAAVCDRTVIARSGSILLHGLTVVRFAGSLDAMRRRMARLEEQVRTVATIICDRARRGGMPPDDRFTSYDRVLALISGDEEVVLDADQAVAAGLVDAVEEDAAAAA